MGFKVRSNLLTLIHSGGIVPKVKSTYLRTLGRSPSLSISVLGSYLHHPRSQAKLGLQPAAAIIIIIIIIFPLPPRTIIIIILPSSFLLLIATLLPLFASICHLTTKPLIP